MSLIAKENYLFLQSHLDTPKEHFAMDDAGRLILMDRSQSIAEAVKSFFIREPLQDGVEAAIFRAKVWGHLVPEVRELRIKEFLSQADFKSIISFLAEIKELRGENPFANHRFEDILNTLERILEQLKPESPETAPNALPWSKIFVSSTLAVATLYSLVNLYLHPDPLIGVFTNITNQFGSDTALLIRTGQAAALSFALLSAVAANRAPEDSLSGKCWRVAVFTGFGCFAVPFFTENENIQALYHLVINTNLG